MDTETNSTAVKKYTVDEFTSALRKELPGFMIDKVELFSDFDARFDPDAQDINFNWVFRGMVMLPMAFAFKQPKAEGDFRLTEKLIKAIGKKARDYYKVQTVENL